MEVIVFEKESFQKLIDELTERVVSLVEKRFQKSEWIDENEAMKELKIKSKTTLQKMRDNLDFDFTQYGKIIQYSRSSILKFLERNRRSIDTF